MFAVIKTGGKQYRVAADDVITVARIEAEPGAAVTFDSVLMFTNDNGTELGGPTVAGVTVAGEVVEQTRGPKVIAFKKRRRQNSKRKRGHRQDLTVVRITQILTGGEKPARAAQPEPEPAAQAAPGARQAEAQDAPQAEAQDAPQAEAQAPEATPAPAEPAAEKKPRAPRKAKTVESGEPATE